MSDKKTVRQQGLLYVDRDGAVAKNMPEILQMRKLIQGSTGAVVRLPAAQFILSVLEESWVLSCVRWTDDKRPPCEDVPCDSCAQNNRRAAAIESLKKALNITK